MKLMIKPIAHRQAFQPEGANRSLRIKLALLFILFTVVPVIVIGVFSYSAAAHSMEAQAMGVIETIADLKVARLESFFKRIQGDIVVAQTLYNAKRLFPVVAKYANHKNDPKYTVAKKILDQQFKIWGKVRHEIVSAGFVGPEGKIVYVSDEAEPDSDSLLDQPLPDPQDKAFIEAKNGLYLSELFEGRRNPKHPVEMLVTLPAFGFKNEFLGVIFFEVDLTFIFDFIRDSTGLGNTGETYAVKNAGDGVLFLNALRHDPRAALKRKEIFGSPSALPAQQAVRGKSGSGVSIDYRGEKVIAAWRYLPLMDWGLVTKVDIEEIFEPIKELKKSVLIIGSAILFLGMPIIFATLRSVLTKPYF